MPQLVEGEKKLLGLRGSSSSPLVVAAMKDLLALKKPDSHALSRKNEIRPFEDASSLEFLASRSDCSAFLFASHSKKRPHNLVLVRASAGTGALLPTVAPSPPPPSQGRTFDAHVLDQVELGISAFEPMSSFSGPKKLLGAVPCFVFQGDAWDREPALARLQNLLLDIFGGRNLTHLALRGVDHAIVVSAVEPQGAAAAAPGAGWGGTIHWRTYFCSLMRSGERVPRVELHSCGPSIDFVLRRTLLASPDAWKNALKQPAQCVWGGVGRGGWRVEVLAGCSEPAVSHPPTPLLHQAPRQAAQEHHARRAGCDARHGAHAAPGLWVAEPQEVQGHARRARGCARRSSGGGRGRRRRRSHGRG